MERITEESEKQIKLRSIKPSAMGRGQKNILLFACDLRSQRYSVFPGISEYFRTLKKKTWHRLFRGKSKTSGAVRHDAICI